MDFEGLKKVLFLPTLARSILYHRVEKFAKYMRMDKESTTAVMYDYNMGENFNSWEANLQNPDFFKELSELAETADIVITQAVHTNQGMAMLCAIKEKFGIPVYAEFDDDPYSLSSQHPYFDNLAPGSQAELWCDDLIQTVDGIFVSTEYLKEQFSKKCGNIHVIPNGIDFQVWDELKDKKRRGETINFGWVGGANHYEDLELIEKPIKYILDKYPSTRFILAIGGEVPPFFARHKQIKSYDFEHWVPIEKYPQFMRNLHIDIGLAPLRDRSFNRAKSNLKWLEYSALKIPMIASPVEPYIGTSGLLAKTEDDWIKHMEDMIKHNSKRRRLGEDSYNMIKQQFDVKDIANDYLKLIKVIINKSNKRSNAHV